MWALPRTLALSSISECGKHTFEKKVKEKCGLPGTPNLINSAELVKMWMNAFCSRASLKPNLVQIFEYQAGTNIEILHFENRQKYCSLQMERPRADHEGTIFFLFFLWAALYLNLLLIMDAFLFLITGKKTAQAKTTFRGHRDARQPRGNGRDNVRGIHYLPLHVDSVGGVYYLLFTCN